MEARSPRESASSTTPRSPRSRTLCLIVVPAAIFVLVVAGVVAALRLQRSADLG